MNGLKPVDSDGKLPQIMAVCVCVHIESTSPIGPYFSQYLPLLVLTVIQYDPGCSTTTAW